MGLWVLSICSLPSGWTHEPHESAPLVTDERMDTSSAERLISHLQRSEHNTHIMNYFEATFHHFFFSSLPLCLHVARKLNRRWRQSVVTVMAPHIWRVGIFLLHGSDILNSRLFKTKLTTKCEHVKSEVYLTWLDFISAALQQTMKPAAFEEPLQSKYQEFVSQKEVV